VVDVTTPSELALALTRARPGDRIMLADGTYAGRFSTARSGTDVQPITLCGSRDAVLDGGTTTVGYGLQLRGDRWNLVGFTVTNAQKGVVLDGAAYNVIDHVAVKEVGHEAIHLRANSTRNRVLDSDISRTGLRNASFGEGIYVGSAMQNWCAYTLCQPDASDGNELVGNRIVGTTAEAIDVKEGTTGGLIEGNTFDGTGRTAGAWVDVKGNDWVVRNNRGVTSTADGFRTSAAAPAWGVGAIFSGNVADVRGPGSGFNLRPGSTLRCDNVVTAAGRGYANVACAD
jgi:hypothetical protein